MPLSDHEQKILEEIERQLYEQDPKFARNVASRARKGHSARNLRRGIGLFVLGVAGLFAFFAKPALTFVGVAAFLLMLSGATLAYNGFKRGGEERAARRGSGGDSMSTRLREQLGKVRKLRRRDGD